MSSRVRGILLGCPGLVISKHVSNSWEYSVGMSILDKIARVFASSKPQLLVASDASLKSTKALNGSSFVAEDKLYVVVTGTSIKSVSFRVADSVGKTVLTSAETKSPYTLMGDSSGKAKAWIPAAGAYTVTATVTPKSGSKTTLTAKVAVKGFDPLPVPVPVPEPEPLPVPVPEPTPVPEPDPVPSSGKGLIQTAPPKLTNPVVITVPVKGGQVNMDPSKDYLVKWPDVPVTSQVTLSGGRNVISLGGEIRNPNHGSMKVVGQTGTIHVEGQIWGDPEALATEGLDIDERKQAPGSKVQIVNILCRNMSGSQSTNHCDVIQNWAASAGTEVIYEKIDGTTPYQGFMWQPGQFGVKPDKWTLIDIVLRRSNSGGYLIFFGTGSTPRNWKNVKLVSSTGKKEIYLESIQAKESGVSVVKDAESPLVGNPGIGYVSPGYVS